MFTPAINRAQTLSEVTQQRILLSLLLSSFLIDVIWSLTLLDGDLYNRYLYNTSSLSQYIRRENETPGEGRSLDEY